MTEIPDPQEQATQPLEQMAAIGVFEGVYGAFADVAKAKLQRNEFVNGQVVPVELNPASEFVQEHFDVAQEKITPLDNTQVHSYQVHDNFISEARTEASREYGGRPAAIATRLERANRVAGSFIDRATTMVRDGETDGLTVKTFFGSLDSLKHSLSRGYNDLVRKSDESVPDQTTKDKYAQTVQSIYGSKPNVEEQHNGGFIHVNGERYLQSGEKTTDRYYISPKLNGEPGEVVRVWAETLDELGLGEKLYYKVATGLARRYDTVIAYTSPETAAETEQAIQTFARKCPPDLLSEMNMPSAVNVNRGISRAPETEQLNTLLRYRGKDTVSYNELAVGLTELALRRASYDFVKQGLQVSQVTPKLLSEASKPYFVQFIKLCGLDPADMKVAA
jgi:hypothetical protein